MKLYLFPGFIELVTQYLGVPKTPDQNCILRIDLARILHFFIISHFMNINENISMKPLLGSLQVDVKKLLLNNKGFQFQRKMAAGSFTRVENHILISTI